MRRRHTAFCRTVSYSIPKEDERLAHPPPIPRSPPGCATTGLPETMTVVHPLVTRRTLCQRCLLRCDVVLRVRHSFLELCLCTTFFSCAHLTPASHMSCLRLESTAGSVQTWSSMFAVDAPCPLKTRERLLTRLLQLPLSKQRVKTETHLGLRLHGHVWSHSCKASRCPAGRTGPEHQTSSVA